MSPPESASLSGVLPPEVWPRLHVLCDEMADFEAAQCDVALQHLLGTVAGLVSAQNAYWLGVVRMLDDGRDPLLGWRPRAIRYLAASPADAAYSRQAIRDMAQGAHDESTMAHVRQAGRFRAPLLRELVSPAWFEAERGTYRSGYLARGIADVLFVAFPVNRDTECYYGFHRKGPPEARFTEAERTIAAQALRSLKWFHRQVLLSHGLLMARTPLYPAERRVLALLLTEASEKEIAHRLGLSVATTHKYVTDILRKFGVRGRAGLTALWLGQAQ